jgi:hypothetical protein
MTELSLSEMLRALSKEYYQCHIGFDEYRARRKVILDRIDEEYNGRKLSDAQTGDAEYSSRHMNTIAFYKSTDIDT